MPKQQYGTINLQSNLSFWYYGWYYKGHGMPKLDKLIRRICSNPPGADFSDIRQLLVRHGWTLRECEGSHCTFVKDGEFPITVPTVSGRRVKRYYCNAICERLGLDEEL